MKKRVGGLAAEMILHGHEHQPSLTIARRWPVERGRNLALLCVAGAGSFGCKCEYIGPFARNHYFIHVRREHDILVRSRMTGDEGLGWVAHEDLSIPVDAPSIGSRQASALHGPQSARVTSERAARRPDRASVGLESN